MRKKVIMMVLVTFLLNPSYLLAKCLNNSIGQTYCAPPGGDITENSIGQLVCGRGQCTTNSIGEVECSNKKFGNAIENSIGQIKCTGRCVPGDRYLCERLE